MLLILVIGFVADYLFFNEFGVYEDDYLFTTVPANWSASDLVQNASYAVQFWPQGRPGWWLINPTLTWLCAQTGSLAAFYLALFAVTSLTTFLIYRFLSRFVPFGAALCGALFFILNPADASGPIIMHMTNYFLVLVMTLVALDVYLSRFRYWSLLLAVVVLTTYEPYFLFFGLFPLWGFLKDRNFKWRSLAGYWLALLGVFLSVMFLRRHLGDDRSTAMLTNLGEVLHKAFLAPWIGAWTNFKVDLRRPWDALSTGTPYTWAITVISAAVLFMAFEPVQRPPARGAQDRGRRSELWLFLIGCAFVLVPYLYRWNDDYYPPIVTLGRLSAMHIPSGFGFSVIIAAILSALGRAPKWLARSASVLVVFYFALLVAVGVRIQRVEHVKSWDLQKKFWTQVFDLTRDAGDGDTIVVNTDEPEGVSTDPRPATEAFPPFWMVSYSSVVYSTLFQFPDNWSRPPAVYSTFDGMKTNQVAGGLQLVTPPWRTPQEWPVIHEGAFIYLEWRGEKLVRVNEPVTIGGHTLRPKPPGAPQKGIQERPAYRLLFPGPVKRWDSIVNGVNYPS